MIGNAFSLAVTFSPLIVLTEGCGLYRELGIVMLVDFLKQTSAMFFQITDM